MTTDTQILQELEALGKEQTRKTYRRHGVVENQYGVSYSDMSRLKKRIKTDHALALRLWASRNHDARILALMIADPQQADSATLEAWVHELTNYVISDALGAYVSQTPLARQKAEAWTQSDEEWIAATGWNILADLATRDQSLPDSYFEPFLATIERDLHSSKNRVRHSMNNAVIAIGLRGEALEARAVAAAERIGKVIVDHGQTNCKTPAAIPYIAKAKARRAEKEKA
jgi:3-methyladenine DNA glycosylase AlkD